MAEDRKASPAGEPGDARSGRRDDVPDSALSGAQLHRNLAAMADCSANFLALVDARLECRYLNPRGRQWVGLALDAPLEGFRLLDYFEDEKGWLTRAVSSAEEARADIRFRSVDGMRILACAINPIDQDGQPERKSWALLAQDVSDERRLEQVERLSHLVFRSMPQGLMIGSFEGRVHSANPAFAAITGYSEEELVGMHPAVWRSGRHPESFYRDLWDEVARTGQWSGELWNKRKSGELYLSSISIYEVPGTEETHRYVTVLNDITEARATEERIRHQAYHDALTGLPNRVLFNDRLEQALRHAQRHGSRVAVMFLDLDRFKMINDSLGHDVGDVVLRGSAERITSCLRGSDTVARLGGDEFTLIVSDFADTGDLAAIAEKIIAVMEQPFPVGGQEVTVTTSVGIAIFPEDGGDVLALMKNADTAMYRAKEAGRNCHRFFTSDMNASSLDQLSLEADLRRAVAKRDFELHYQPKFDCATGRLCSMEALLRWTHPQRGPVSPAAFIGLAEETGLIVPLGEWVLRTACAQMKRWRDGTPDGGLDQVRMAVNMSARQFHRRDLVENVAAILAETGLPAQALEIEITESAIMKNVEEAAQVMRDLKAMGIAISIDDFGTGYSSLGYLRAFPIDTLKIDRSFIGTIGQTKEGEAIVSAIIRLAQGLNLRVIAEGVETDEQLDFLRAEQCGAIQGYLFCRPLAPAEFERRLDAWQRGAAPAADTV